MVEVQRTSILSNFANELNLQTLDTPKEVNKIISPTFDVNPKYTDTIRSATSAITGSNTLYTTPRDKDFYITALSLGVTKDVANDCTQVYIECTQGGVARRLIAIPVQTLTAESHRINLNFSYPIKCDRNTAISGVGTFTVGTMTKTFTVMGFILE